MAIPKSPNILSEVALFLLILSKFKAVNMTNAQAVTRQPLIFKIAFSSSGVHVKSESTKCLHSYWVFSDKFK